MIQVVDNSYKRICLIGGPSAGKSTIASELFSYWKRNSNTSPELVREYVKNWAWEGKQPRGFDQIYLLGKQMYSEERVLRGGATPIITDSPLFLSYIYAQYSLVNRSEALANSILTVVQEFDKIYRPLFVIVNRGDKPYDPKGRFQDVTSAFYIEDRIFENLPKFYNQKDIISINYNDTNASKYVYDYAQSRSQ